MGSFVTLILGVKVFSVNKYNGEEGKDSHVHIFLDVLQRSNFAHHDTFLFFLSHPLNPDLPSQRQLPHETMLLDYDRHGRPRLGYMLRGCGYYDLKTGTKTRCQDVFSKSSNNNDSTETVVDENEYDHL
jgi:hypothetical protein